MCEMWVRILYLNSEVGSERTWEILVEVTSLAACADIDSLVSSG